MADQDYSIPLKSNPVQVQNPLDLAVKASQLSELQAIGAERRVETAQKQRAYDEQSVIQGAYQRSTTSDGQIDEPTLLQNLRGSRYPYLADQVAIQRTNNRLALQEKNQEFKLNAFHSITDQASYDQAAQSLADAGFPDIRKGPMGPTYDSDPKSQMRRMLLDARVSSMKDADQIGVAKAQAENYQKNLEAQTAARKEGVLQPGSFTPGVAPGVSPLVQPTSGPSAGPGPAPAAPSKTPPPPSSVSPNASMPGQYSLDKTDPAEVAGKLYGPNRAKEIGEEIKPIQTIAYYAPDLITNLKNASDITRDPIAAAQDFKNAKALFGTLQEKLEKTTRKGALDQLEETFDPSIWTKLDQTARKSAVATAERILRGAQISPTLKALDPKLNPDLFESTNIGAKLDKIPEFPARNVRVIMPDGKVKEGPRNNLQNFLKSNPGSKVAE